MVKLRRIEERKFLSPQMKRKILKVRNEKLKQLTDSCNLSEYMGELLLNEIKLSKDKANRYLRERIEILGL